MKKFILILFAANQILTTVAQDKTKSYSKWYIKPAVGINLPITKLLIHESTDNLLEYDDNTYYWQFISATYFFHEKWGIEFTYQASTSKKIHERSNSFNSELHNEYSDVYHVTPSSGAEIDNFNIIRGSFEKGYLGIVYRVENKRILFLPKLYIGVTSFYADWGRANLKEKGTSSVLITEFGSDEIPNDHFTLAPSCTFGYRLSKRLIVNLDLFYSYFKTNILYTKETRNIFTGESLFETFNYNKNIHTFSAGIGLIIELKPTPNKS